MLQQSSTDNVVGDFDTATKTSFVKNETALHAVLISQQEWTQANLYEEAVPEQSNTNNEAMACMRGFLLNKTYSCACLSSQIHDTVRISFHYVVLLI